jgi:uncharacterized membrane protein
MVRVFIAVFFVFTVAGVPVAGGAAGADPSRLQSSVESQDTVGRMSFCSLCTTARVSKDSATVSESRMKAAIPDALKSTPLPWLISFAVVVLVIVGGGAAYRNTVRTKTTAETDTAGSESTITEEDLISDNDRVLLLLQDNDGRMRQANIVHQTDWSKSKVSMVLSEMDDEDLITKLRIGRENIISIAGDEPEAARSPFEDEK